MITMHVRVQNSDDQFSRHLAHFFKQLLADFRATAGSTIITPLEVRMAAGLFMNPFRALGDWPGNVTEIERLNRLQLAQHK